MPEATAWKVARYESWGKNITTVTAPLGQPTHPHAKLQNSWAGSKLGQGEALRD